MIVLYCKVNTVYRESENALTSPGESARGSADAILDAARRLFMASGFDGVNLDQVGKAAGVSRQTVYNQFGSKDAVFRAMVTRYWGAITAELDRACALVLAADDDPETMLRRLAETLYRLVGTADQVALARLVVAESRRGSARSFISPANSRW